MLKRGPSVQQQAGVCSAHSTRASGGLALEAATVYSKCAPDGGALQLRQPVVGPHPLPLGLLNGSAGLMSKRHPSVN